MYSGAPGSGGGGMAHDTEKEKITRICQCQLVERNHAGAMLWMWISNV